jgi:hemerythrin
MYNKTILDAETVPHVEIDFMNNTHFEEIDMVKALGEKISAYQENDNHSDAEINQISKELRAWLDHTIPHFERENELMRETGFPAYGVHSEEHQIALERMKTVINAWEENQDIDLLADYVFTMWPQWFNGHVNSMDMMTAKFAKMNGFNEEQQKAS